MKAWLSALLLCTAPAFAQMVEVQDEPATGTDRAREYFQNRRAERPARTPAQDGGGKPRFLALHVGSFFTDQGYKWGKGNQDDIGKLNAGVTYRVGEWVNSMDLNFRVDYTNYGLDEGNARKLSFLGLISFPDANSRFPLYFGLGGGIGAFLKNVRNESALSFDYHLIAGARFLDVFEGVGFMVETGLKNHILLLSEGQFNGVFINVGTVFAF